MHDDFRSKLKRGLIWNVLGTVMSKGFVMLAAILTARILGADKNGEFGMINNTVGMFSTFAALGLGTTATRFIAEFKGKDKERCGNILALTIGFACVSSVVLAIVLVFSGNWLAINTLNNPGLAQGLQFSSIMLVFNTMNTIQNSILAGFEEFKSLAKIAIFQGVISLPIFLLLTSFLGVNGLVIGYGLVAIFSFLVARVRILNICRINKIKISYRHCFQEYKILIRFSIPSMLMNLVVMPVTWVGNTIIINNLNGYFNLGVFNAANQWRSAITLLPAAIGNVILPYIISNGDDDEIEDLNILLSWIIVIFISSGIIFVSRTISAFYGDSYPIDILDKSIVLICFICGFLSFKEGIARNLIKYGYMWFGFFSNLLWGISFLMSIILLKNFGAIGITLAYLFSYVITTIVFIPFYIHNKIVDIKYFVNKKVLCVWASFTLQIILSLFISNTIIRFVLMIVTICSLFLVIAEFFNMKSFKKYVRKKIEGGYHK